MMTGIKVTHKTIAILQVFYANNKEFKKRGKENRLLLLLPSIIKLHLTD